jgi:hypothetical protein
MIHSRRGFLTGLVGLVAAPAVCKAEWLMPVKAIIKPRTASDIWALQQESLDRLEVLNARLLSRLHADALHRYAEWQRVIEGNADMSIYKVYGTPLVRRPIVFTSS